MSLAIGKGEGVAFFGHNGAGKTTLLKIIATHMVPSQGTVRILGNDPGENGPRARRRIGLVTHEHYLYPELTVRENLEFYARLFSVEDEHLYRAMADDFGLARWYHEAAGKLSFGLRKRADIIRALLHDPDLILLDEPFAGLDDRTCALLVHRFSALRERGKTLVVSSHSREWMERLCDRELVFERGRIVHDIPRG